MKPSRTFAAIALLIACYLIGIAIATPPPLPATLLSSAEASMPNSPLPYLASGPSLAASGTMTGNVASDLTFSTPCQWTYISNRTGSTAYVSINRPTGVLTTSTSVFDFALDNGEDILVDGWLKIDSLTIYVSPTAGFRAVGW